MDGVAAQGGPGGGAGGRARVYRTLRSAHLEQALQLAPALVVHRQRRYDFDETLAARLDVVQAGPWAAALLLLRRGVRQVEVNEPLMRGAVRDTARTVAALRLVGALTGRRVQVVAYGIENLDPYAAPLPSPRWRAAAARDLDRRLSRFVWRRLDRFASGTAAARDLYAATLPATRAAQRLVPAVPAPCDCPPQDRPAGRVLFLGAFSERKGFADLRRAWPGVTATCPHARLQLVGQGAMLAEAERWAAQDPTVELLLDPPRTRVHEELRRAAVLVLPSRRTVRWREQVGRPLVEGLAHGCTVVTTTETGLAPWLAEHGHTVLAPDRVDPPADGLTTALADAVRAGRSAAAVLADLPVRDGRLAADDWLFEDAGLTRG
ncbi:glycosyltransferase [Kineococcus endophyticus]|uniref:Glycosyltransferase n=1 Tax=Kineococcus endophyticus TaxID=1181883 RepID=A0ABV3P1L9_9ACTN